MIVFIMTDMEGLAGIDKFEQCYDVDDNSPNYLYGREQLTADLNAAAAGAFDAGATEVRVLDGHGRNGNKGFIPEKLDKRVKSCWFTSRDPIRWEGIDEDLTAVAMVGQHSMAGTLHGFLDHTQNPRNLCRFLINGREQGEMSQFALYAGGFGVPFVYASGDEALCEEAKTLFPHVVTTPTKKGTGWLTCELYPPDEVRKRIRADIARSLQKVDRSKAWTLPAPMELAVEWACSADADWYATFPGVRRDHARIVSWSMNDPLDVYTWPPPKKMRKPVGVSS